MLFRPTEAGRASEVCLCTKIDRAASEVYALPFNSESRRVEKGVLDFTYLYYSNQKTNDFDFPKILKKM